MANAIVRSVVTLYKELSVPGCLTDVDAEGPADSVTREFWPDCGTHILGRSPRLLGSVLLKPGSLDDPSAFGRPQLVVFTIDKQSFHHVPEDVPTFERTPG